MSVHVEIYPNGYVHATVQGAFDLNSARKLLMGVKGHWVDGSTEIFVSLYRVTYTNACAIGAMALLSELAKRNFHVRIVQCAAPVHELFESGLLERHFPRDMLQGCRDCMAGHGRGCDVPALFTGNPPGAAVAGCSND